MNSARVADVLRKISEQAAEREHELSAYSADRRAESDDDADAVSPIFDSFYES